MKKALTFAIGLACLLILDKTDVTAQVDPVKIPQYNPNSVDPVPAYEQLYKVGVYRRLNLQEKQNKGFFAVNSEISKIIIEGVLSGEIKHIYNNDSLKSEMTKEEFQKKLQLYEEPPVSDAYPWDDLGFYYEGDIVEYNGKTYVCLQDNEGEAPDTSTEFWQTETQEADNYQYNEISVMDMREDVIFDKRRARLYHDIQSIELFVRADVAVEQINKSIGAFSFKELEDYFRRRPDLAIWYNQYNSAENKNFADAFLLRMFHGHIRKIENPDNMGLNQIYTRHPKEWVFASEWMEMQLMEKEHNLWSY